jgi:hypothetical protein
MYGVAEFAGYRRRSYDLWQEMAGSWERGREVLWETTRPVSEWLVDRLAPQPGETILDSPQEWAKPAFWPLPD